jgi:Tol biopolymer transport system component
LAAGTALLLCLALGGMPVVAQEASESPPPTAPVAASEPPPGETLPTASASPLPDSVRPPAESRIAYVTGETGTSPTIHVIAADGSADASVAPGTLPSWAPDGEHFAYTCKPERWDYFGSVCIHDLPSGTSTVVIAHGTLPLWSPAGGLIAFSRDVWALGDAWIYQAEPRATWKLPGGMPEWSPTGRWLRFLTARGMPERPVTHVVRPDGSDARSLGTGWNATWSPDGRRIAATWWDGARSSITAIDIKTGAREGLFETDAPILALRWLPGDGLAFLAEREASSTGDLRVVELSSGVVRSLTSGLAVTPDLTVAPDGQWLAFTVTGDGTSDIYIASRQGGWARLTTTGDATRPAWKP